MKLSKKNIAIIVVTTLLVVFIGSFLRQPKVYTFYKEQFVPFEIDVKSLKKARNLNYALKKINYEIDDIDN